MSMDPRQRFKLDRPCPVCAGHEDMPHKEERRCYGFLSDDGLYAHCTREKYAGEIGRNNGSNTFAHRLEGVCRCGKIHSPESRAPQSALKTSKGTPSVDSYRHSIWGQPSKLWAYWHANGELAGYEARWDRPGGGKVIRPLVIEDGRWRQKGIPKPRPLYNLPALWERPEAPVIVAEGEKTADAAGQLFPSHIAITSMGGAKSPHLSDWSPLRGRDVVIWPDNDADGQRYAREVAALALKAGASSALIVQLPEGLPDSWDLADSAPEGVDVEKLLADAEPADVVEGDTDADGKGAGQGQTVSSGDRLLQWASEQVELYCDGEEAYADVLIDGHRETMPVRSRGFNRWLRKLYRDETGRGAPQEALTHAVENLDAEAAWAEQRKVHIRTASHNGRLYVDLGDDTWRVVEIDAGGWRILSGPPEVRFRRTTTMKSLPVPLNGDSVQGINALRGFLNVGEGDFVLCVAWLLASLRDTGPYPILALTGEHGAAKSTAARLILSLVDPARPPTRGVPRDERDVVIAARNRHVLALDNLSGLPAWLSDTLCRLSTGEGYLTRALYTDDAEVVFEAQRPAILNGIENPSVRGDLADRSIIIRLAPIADTARRTESELMDAFEEVRPRIFGALLDGLSEGLRNYDSVNLGRLPRMADFCRWVVACEGAFWSPGTFLATYDDAQASATEDVVENSPIWPALRQFLEESPDFDGTATELLNQIGTYKPDDKSPRGWPSTGAAMGKQLMRLAPSLRKLGYTADWRKTKDGNFWRLASLQQASGLALPIDEELEEKNETA